MYKSDEGMHLGFASCYGDYATALSCATAFEAARHDWLASWLGVVADAPISAQIAKNASVYGVVGSFCLQRAAIRALKEDVAPAREVSAAAATTCLLA